MGGNCPGGIVPGAISWGVIARGAIVQRVIVLEPKETNVCSFFIFLMDTL